MKNLYSPGLALVLLLATPAIVQGEPTFQNAECVNSGDPAAVSAVRLQRQAFNQAIVEKDLEAVANILDDAVTLITGSDSDIYSGAQAQLKLWTGDFENPDRAIYVRTPACIRVSLVLPIALEYGSWRGERVMTKDAFASGSYAAKWRKSGNQWLLESEVFATEDCGGNFCPLEE